ncbi:DUF3375 domain-containing protein [Haloferula sp.]|uniref:DUF3375 domain-containing protein n=1 Tax=Haloferula sp. TaxID=2497595 RepID=UPI003C70BEDD
MADLNYNTLQVLQKEHPAWRLLRSDHAPLVVSFLNRVFVQPNVRVIPEADLAEALEDELFGVRERFDLTDYPRPAREYLNDWASPEKGWLRKFYLRGTDEAHFDLVPATERVITWLGELGSRAFVGTESRLLTLFELLRQMAMGSETDPETRVTELQKRRDEIDREIAAVLAGDVALLDDTGMRDRFQQFTQMARELLSDFREVEHNFRTLDRSVRERIALWEGGKAALLDEILGRRDAIDDSDQGRSFRAFWDFLMSDRRQQELTKLLDSILDHAAVRATDPDPRLRRVHYDWLEAGDHTQRTVADLSKQLRRFLDDKAWLENRRIMDLLHGIETKSLAVRETPPGTAFFMNIRETSAAIQLPFERPLYTPPFKPDLNTSVLAADEVEIDAAALFAVRFVDKAALSSHIRHALQNTPQVSLRELVESKPLEHGLAEIIAYLEVASGSFKITIDESSEEILVWESLVEGGIPLHKSARLPRVIFVR